MRRVLSIVTCLAAIASLAAVMATDALAAEPAIYECAKLVKIGGKYTGKYLDKKCSKEATPAQIAEGKKNKYELKEGIGKGKPFSGKSKGANLNVATIGGIDCKAATDTGEFTSPTTAGNVVAKFTSCVLNGKTCQSGATAGEVVTKPLDGTVGYLEGKGTPSPKVGGDVKPEVGEYLAEFTCPPNKYKVSGSVIGEITPINTFTKTATFTFKQEAIGVQAWESFEGGLSDVLTTTVEGAANGNLASSEEAVFVNKGETLELKA